jgi:hypothetical protein
MGSFVFLDPLPPSYACVFGHMSIPSTKITTKIIIITIATTIINLCGAVLLFPPSLTLRYYKNQRKARDTTTVLRGANGADDFPNMQ